MSISAPVGEYSGLSHHEKENQDDYLLVRKNTKQH